MVGQIRSYRTSTDDSKEMGDGDRDRKILEDFLAQFGDKNPRIIRGGDAVMRERGWAGSRKGAPIAEGDTWLNVKQPAR